MPDKIIIVILICLLTTLVMAVLIRAIVLGIKRFINRSGIGLIANALIEPTDNSTPRSLSNLTNTYSQIIERDFPELDVRQLLTSAENMLVKILNCIESCEVLSQDSEKCLSKNLVDKINNQIEDIKSKGEKWFFDDIYVHKSAISDYNYRSGKRTIRIEIALQYCYSVSSGGVNQNKSKLDQYKYVVEAVYIQDVDKLGDNSMKGHSCPNCGAPVKEVGDGKFCRYCGTGLMEVNVRIWTFDNYNRC